MHMLLSIYLVSGQVSMVVVVVVEVVVVVVVVVMRVAAVVVTVVADALLVAGFPRVGNTGREVCRGGLLVRCGVG